MLNEALGSDSVSCVFLSADGAERHATIIGNLRNVLENVRMSRGCESIAIRDYR
jgi:hypothetical protein